MEEIQSKNLADRGVRRLGKVRLMYLLAVWSVITLGVVCMIGAASRTSERAIGYQRMTTEKAIRCNSLAAQMKSGSDRLTNAVWQFAATGQTEYALSYLDEAEQDRSRDKAIEALRNEELTEEELDLIENAKQRSDNLMELEYHAMRLIYESGEAQPLSDKIAAIPLTQEEEAMTGFQKRQCALQIVFGSDYQEAKEQIVGQIERFNELLELHIGEELSQAMEQTDRAFRIQKVTSTLLIVWCAVFLAVLYRVMVHPIYISCRELEGIKQEDRMLTPRGPYELRRLILAFNGAIGRLRARNQEISDILMVDPVTGGFTAARFEMELTKYLKNPTKFAFVSMDIRRFKLINDSYGSDEGNRVLRRIYQVACGCLKKGEYVARIQSDIFNLALLETGFSEIEKRMEEIATRINDPEDKTVLPYHLSLNCGVYLVPLENQEIITIRDRANVARKVGKQKSDYLLNCVFYSDLERQKLLREQAMENEMQRALEDEEFLVYLQPKVRLSDEKIIGAEALVRWDSPVLGMIQPGDFIPLFERNGFITKLDYYMFRQVCRLLQEWMKQGISVVPVAVNLSRKHILEDGFIRKFMEARMEYGIPSRLLEFELTEAVVFEDLERIKQIIAQLHSAGFRCAMDDFGSGYSSLNVLKEVSVDILKLDRGFFVGDGGERASNVVKAVVGMAKELGMETVAEGVESEDLCRFLKENGCDTVQGFFYYRPMPAEEFAGLLVQKKE